MGHIALDQWKSKWRLGWAVFLAPGSMAHAKQTNKRYVGGAN